MVSEFGQTGNVLTEFRNNLQMAILSTPRPRKLILSEAFEKFVGERRSFDALGATHSWAGVFENRSAAVSHARRANASVFELNAADSYFQASLRQQLRAVDANGTHLVDGFEPQVVTRHEYSQIVMAQTILRPTPPLLVHVEAFMESELACFQKAAGITDAGDGTPQTSAAAAAAASGSINRRPEVGDAVVFTMDKTSWIDGEEAVGEPDVGPCEARPHLSFKRLDEFVVAAVEGDCFSSTSYPTLWAPIAALAGFDESAHSSPPPMRVANCLKNDRALEVVSTPVASPPVASPPMASPPVASPPVASPPVASPSVLAPVAYNAVHLRGHEVCKKLPNQEAVEAAQFLTAKDLGRKLSPEDYCGMSDEYIDACLRKAGAEGRPMVLAHDGQSPERAAAIRARYNAVSYSGPHAAFVDLLLLTQSAFLVGNPASTFSFTAAMVRKAVLQDPATNLGGNFYIENGPDFDCHHKNPGKLKNCVPRPSMSVLNEGEESPGSAVLGVSTNQAHSSSMGTREEKFPENSALKGIGF